MEIEMSKVKWDIIGVSEVRRHEENLITLKSGHILYSIGSETESIGVVGFFIHKRLADDIVYAPTTDHPDEEIEDFYDDISAALKETLTHNTIICGDFNAKIGLNQDEQETALGKFLSKGRNERGETLLEFLLQQNLYQMNSFFSKKDHRRWTWKSLDDKCFIGGDLNGHIGTERAGIEMVHGGLGMGIRNDKGNNVIDFAVA
ncbi:uncharacterized protein [Diabrotica undecimpunctata]|uniref:uncharacterized protein n=1 Tax=Diabrotica undecimpunctata TaxID=50387 RepID=UPI003B640200